MSKPIISFGEFLAGLPERSGISRSRAGLVPPPRYQTPPEYYKEALIAEIAEALEGPSNNTPSDCGVGHGVQQAPTRKGQE